MSDTSKSVSLLSTIINEQYHFMTSCDGFPVPVRSAVKSNLTAWCCYNLSNRTLNVVVVVVTLNALTVQPSTTELGRLFVVVVSDSPKPSKV